MHLPRSLLAAPLLVAAAALFAAPALEAAALPCSPCAGVRLERTGGIGEALAAQRLEPNGPLYVAWTVPLDGSAGAAPAAEVARAGGTPWLTLAFRTPPPLAQNAARLQEELQVAARVAAEAPGGTFFQVLWRPEGREAPELAAADLPEYAFLLKRAAVALTGARPDGRVASAPLPADRSAVAALYAQEVAAYLEALVLRPGAPEAVAGAIEAVAEAAPGQAVALDALPLPAAAAGIPAEVIAEAARWAVRGVDLALFAVPEATPATLVPFALLAREFAGDVSFDPYSVPAGAQEAWAFVRGKDLALRVIALVPEGAPEVTLRFEDTSLRRPVRFPLAAGQVAPPAGQVTPGGLEIRLADPGRVAVLGLERPTAEEREGVAEKVTVAGEREVPVEEILRRLQAFEDAQARRLEHYQATNTTHMRFQVGATTQTVEATLQGPFFFSDEGGSDWAWQNLYINGVRWRGKSIPEIPLIQPEKAAALPLEITFTKQYRYRLRGTDVIEGRRAWVIDFAPAAGSEGKLYQGTVWVDREIHSRLRTRAVQLGLEGEVLSNEETLIYTPVDAQGRPAPWTAESFILPLRLVAQQILSVVNATTVVDRETLLTDVRINGPGFEAARSQVAATDVTMVRDTQAGLRYLVKDEAGERVVKEGFDTSKLFAAGGVFYDDALDYPLPLAGVNYFSFDFRGTGQQVNAFFGGALLTVNVAEPRLFGSRFDLGGDAFGIAIPLTDTFYREGREVTAEEIESRPASAGLKLGHPLGNFVKLGLEYDVLYLDYGATDNTAGAFVLPANHFLHSLGLNARFARSGYRANLQGGYSRRSEWEPWGLPGSTDYDPDHRDFLRWDAAASKTWYLPYFQKVGIEVDYAGGSDLDRFSKYEFGFFGGTRVHGYQSNRVRASEAWAGHLAYGFEVGETLRLEAIGDVALATDEDTGLDQEMLAGAGVQGTFLGPWQTVVNLDVGVPVAGPDDGFVLYVLFLKLFR